MTGTTLGALVPEDTTEIACIHAACFDEAWSARMLQRILAMPGAFGICARQEIVGGAVAGFALARVAADECELLSLGVSPDFRRQGLGARLLDAAMARASAANAISFFLEVAEHNDAAIRLYKSRGLVPVGRRRDYYELKSGGFADALTMRRKLTLAVSSPG